MSTSQSAVSQCREGFHTVPGTIHPGNLCFRSGFVGFVKIWKDFRSGYRTVSSPTAAGSRRWRNGQLSPRASTISPSHPAISQCRTGFHTVRGGVDPDDLRSRSRFVGVGEIWKYFHSGCRTVSSPGAAGTLRWPAGNLSPRASSISPSPISNQPVPYGILHPAGRYLRGESPFSSGGCWICKDLEEFQIR